MSLSATKFNFYFIILAIIFKQINKYSLNDKTIKTKAYNNITG